MSLTLSDYRLLPKVQDLYGTKVYCETIHNLASVNLSKKVWKFVFAWSYFGYLWPLYMMAHTTGKPVHFPLQWCLICNNQAFVWWAAQLTMWVDPKWNVSNMPLFVLNRTTNSLSVLGNKQHILAILHFINWTSSSKVWGAI